MTLNPPPASIKDVARFADVSIGTVSNVLNRPHRVTPAMRDRVQAAIVDLGFVRNESARHLRAGTSHTVAFVMPDVGNPFFTDVASGIESAAEAAGLTVMLCNSASRAAREQVHLQLAQEQRVVGVLVTPVDPDPAALVELQNLQVPVVILEQNRSVTPFCTVAVDDVQGGRIAIEHLIELGHRSVAFAGARHGAGQVGDRLTGARHAWSAAGLAPEALVLLDADSLDVSGGREVGRLLGDMPAAERPTAAFCPNDLMALGLLQHALASGVDVPSELAIVGYDDIAFAGAAAVPLTSVRQPCEQLGSTAVELLLEEAADSAHAHRSVVFQPELITRTSTTG